MTATATRSAYGELLEPRTVRIERLLPGPIDRVWAYLTDSDLRAQWLAAGEMEARPGATVTFTWRNDDLSGGADERPEGMEAEHSMACTVIRAEAPRLLVLGWGASGSEVTFELEPRSAEVLLTLTHRKLSDRGQLLGVSAGWHAHLDLMVARLRGEAPPPFWSNWKRLRAQYDARIPA
ncbi:SRPBCC family protein [Phenylobacterium sp.]|uniref:SRPBCC family protein n=1 Tax=Phenylobacterium sp. TaxID=1871053 RepID=UPI0025E200F7|nr:SRPBCC family protein [Phenylobacterium sp.]